MDQAFRDQAERFRQQNEQEVDIAVSWLRQGVIRPNATFVDEAGREPFSGCLERLAYKTVELSEAREYWVTRNLALWCKQEADAWFEGFDDDTEEKRRDFTATLFHRAKEQVILNELEPEVLLMKMEAE